MVLYEIERSKKDLQELDDAYEWYEEQLAGLGSRLLKEVNKYLTTISKSPKLFQICFPDEIRADKETGELFKALFKEVILDRA